MQRFEKNQELRNWIQHCRHLQSHQTNANFSLDVDFSIGGPHPLPFDSCSYQINKM